MDKMILAKTLHTSRIDVDYNSCPPPGAAVVHQLTGSIGFEGCLSRHRTIVSKSVMLRILSSSSITQVSFRIELVLQDNSALDSGQGRRGRLRKTTTSCQWPNKTERVAPVMIAVVLRVSPNRGSLSSDVAGDCDELCMQELMRLIPRTTSV